MDVSSAAVAPQRLDHLSAISPPFADSRVRAVLEVISGTPVTEVAASHDVESAVLQRWLTAFINAGSARITNHPEGELAAQRDRFLAAFAHELRTPLAVAQGWAAMLAEGDLPPSMTQATAAKLDGALDDVVARVRDVEHLAAVALGRLRLYPRPTSVGEIVSAAGVPLDPGEQACQRLVTDPDLAARALHDLWLATALHPTPRRRRLTVTRTRLWLELRITREAEPIEPRVLMALFEPFDTNDDDTGVSIGLYLARALSVALGGAIGLEQRDASSDFWLRLPHDFSYASPITSTQEGTP